MKMARASFGTTLKQPKMSALLILGFSSGLPLFLTSRTLQAWMTVDGVDLIALGPTDICAALGITDPPDPRLRQTFQELVAKVKAYVPVNHSALRFSPS